MMWKAWYDICIFWNDHKILQSFAIFSEYDPKFDRLRENKLEQIVYDRKTQKNEIAIMFKLKIDKS